MQKFINTMQLELLKLYKWLLCNKLTLNIYKNHEVNIEINKMVIEQVKYTKFLCIIFYDNLDWSNHLSYINSK